MRIDRILELRALSGGEVLGNFLSIKVEKPADPKYVLKLCFKKIFKLIK